MTVNRHFRHRTIVAAMIIGCEAFAASMAGSAVRSTKSEPALPSGIVQSLQRQLRALHSSPLDPKGMAQILYRESLGESAASIRLPDAVLSAGLLKRALTEDEPLQLLIRDLQKTPDESTTGVVRELTELHRALAVRGSGREIFLREFAPLEDSLTSGLSGPEKEAVLDNFFDSRRPHALNCSDLPVFAAGHGEHDGMKGMRLTHPGSLASEPGAPIAIELASNPLAYGQVRWETQAARFKARLARRSDAVTFVAGLFARPRRDNYRKIGAYYSALSPMNRRLVRFLVSVNEIFRAVRNGEIIKPKFWNNLGEEFLWFEQDGIFGVYRPSIELPTPIPSEKKLPKPDYELRMQVLDKGRNFMAHGVEAKKGGLTNLVDILLSGQIGDGFNAYFGRLGITNAEYGAAEHGPYYILVRDSGGARETNHIAYLVPSEMQKTIALRALREGVSQGLIGQDVFDHSAPKIKTYREFLDEPLPARR